MARAPDYELRPIPVITYDCAQASVKPHFLFFSCSILSIDGTLNFDMRVKILCKNV